MLFCQYPFERSSDDGDKRRNQLVMQRTVAGWSHHVWQPMARPACLVPTGPDSHAMPGQHGYICMHDCRKEMSCSQVRRSCIHLPEHAMQGCSGDEGALR